MWDDVGCLLEQFTPSGQQITPEQRVDALHEWAKGFRQVLRHSPTKPSAGRAFMVAISCSDELPGRYECSAAVCSTES